jgi:hypothetical protein
MREFNTSGPNNPDIHFTVMREALLQKALEQITRPADPKGGRYFTLYAPRQTGKTTFVEQLMKRLDRRQFFPAMISFESLAGLEEFTFYRELGKRLDRMGNFPFAIPEMSSRHDFEDFLSALKTQIPQKLCLIIDDCDAIDGSRLGDFLHLIREVFHARGQSYNLHSLILISVRNLAEIDLGDASPFNIGEELRLRFFIREETYDLIGQYEAESGQQFAPEAKQQLFYETQGQPELVNVLCKRMVEDLNPGPGKTIGPEIANKAVEQLLHLDIFGNLATILKKARKAKKHVIALLDAAAKTEFHIDMEWQKFLWLEGIIDVEDLGGWRKYVKFSCPLYEKKLREAFHRQNRKKARFG